MRITQHLVKQSGNPSGFVGNLLLTAMDLAHRKVIEKALDPIRNDRSYTILDIGCGSGRALEIMNNRFHHSQLYGIDISETCVQKARNKNRKTVNSNLLDIQLGNVMALSHEDHSMDIITAFQTHYFWPDIDRACKEIQRVLRSNGIFILCGDLLKMKYHLNQYQLIEDYPSLLREKGFCAIAVFPFHGFMIAYGKKSA